MNGTNTPAAPLRRWRDVHQGLVLFLLLIAAIGCVRPVGPNPAPKPGTSPDYFEAFADNLPERSDELLWCVRKLHDGGQISDAELSAFEAKFNGDDRELTESDKATLRGLK